VQLLLSFLQLLLVLLLQQPGLMPQVAALLLRLIQLLLQVLHLLLPLLQQLLELCLCIDCLSTGYTCCCIRLLLGCLNSISHCLPQLLLVRQVGLLQLLLQVCLSGL
jgi:hypothetical protein